MAALQQMLDLCGSWEKAEQQAKEFIAAGNMEEWLNLGLLYAACGRHEESKQCGKEYEKYFPNCPRLKFGMGYYQLMEGNFLHGMKMVYEGGRACNNFGSPPPEIGVPVWNGEDSIKGKKVLLRGEGGMGDEIINVRFAKPLSKLGASVIVSSSKSLMATFSRVDGVNAVLDERFLGSVYFDYWVPAMAAPYLCKCLPEDVSNIRTTNLLKQDTYTKLQGTPYISPPATKIWETIIPRKEGQLNVGFRWAGLPMYEHQQLRKFPTKSLIDVMKTPGIKCYSFQRDADLMDLPEHITDLAPFLKDWEDTSGALSRMDLVISSCTSLAHMSGALGRPTWIILPVMSYYTWALPGETSPWYNSVRLFRQTKLFEWDDVLNKVCNEVKRKVNANV